MIHCWRTSERLVKYPHRTNRSCLLAFLFFTAICFSSQHLSILCVALSSSGLCFVFRAPTLSESVGTVPSPCVLRRRCSERKGVVCPYHNHYTALRAHSVVLRLQKTHFSQAGFRSRLVGHSSLVAWFFFFS